mmetsp:Transcript_17745/g.24442  ORF Transcript_17745/g.24442 Transcript_17745/m.24442 type:complete len:125 (+) Transcript_17745:36-410(+)
MASNHPHGWARLSYTLTIPFFPPPQEPPTPAPNRRRTPSDTTQDRMRTLHRSYGGSYTVPPRLSLKISLHPKHQDAHQDPSAQPYLPQETTCTQQGPQRAAPPPLWGVEPPPSKTHRSPSLPSV